MKIFLICSKAFYDKIEPIKSYLEEKGHEIILPNTYNDVFTGVSQEQLAWEKGEEAHREFKSNMLKMSSKKIGTIDAVLCLNYEKKGIANYIGAATFLELYEAFMQDKKIYLMNDIPEGILYDELSAFGVKVLNGNLDLVE